MNKKTKVGHWLLKLSEEQFEFLKSCSTVIFTGKNRGQWWYNMPFWFKTVDKGKTFTIYHPRFLPSRVTKILNKPL